MAKESIAPLGIGTVLNGFRIESVLGVGGFGITYLAVELSSGRRVVIKENIPGVGATRKPGMKAFDIPDTPDATNKGGAVWSEENFINEARRLVSLEHPGVVRVLQVFRSLDTRTAYYSMPYVEATSLQKICDDSRNFSRQWVMYLTASLLDTLAYMHRRNLLHRDIKPENILVPTTGRPVFIDFGSSRKMDTDTHTRMVSPSYSPIEQQRGELEGPWTDIYALGATLYRVITGNNVPLLALRGDGRDMYEPLVDKPELVKVYGREFLATVDHALAYLPEDRCRSVAEWTALLSNDPDFQCAVPILYNARIGSAATVLLRGTEIDVTPRKSTRWLWGLLVFVLLLLALVLALLVYSCTARRAQLDETGQTPMGAPVAAEVKTVTVAPIDDIGVPLLSEPETPEKAEPEPPRIIDPPEESEPVSAPEMPAVSRVILRKGARLYPATSPGGSEFSTVPAFQVFHVTGQVESGGAAYYKVSPTPATVGQREEFAVLGAEVFPWPTQTALRFTPLYNNADPEFTRHPAVMFENADKAKDYVKSTPAARSSLVDTLRAIERAGKEAGKLPPPGVLAIEPLRERGSLQYWMPVLAADSELLQYNMTGSGKNSQATSVVQVASMAVPMEVQSRKMIRRQIVDRPAPAADIVFVIDTTASMSQYLDSVLKLIRETAQELEQTAVSKQMRLRFGLVGYRDRRAAHEDGTGEDPAFTRKIGYVAHYYNDGRLLSAGDFVSWLDTADARELPVVSKVDSIDYAEDVQAGLHLACKDTRWWPADTPDEATAAKGLSGLRFICLIGDAPGRARGERESSELNWRSTKAGRRNDNDLTWRHRPEGSIVADASFGSLHKELASQGVHLSSVFVMTMPKKNTGIKEDSWWNLYQKPAIRQYCEISTSKGEISDVETPSCYIFNPVRDAMSPDYQRRLSSYLSDEMRLSARNIKEGSESELTDYFIRTFQRGIKALCEIVVEKSQSVADRSVLDSAHMEARSGESAISRMFACAYMNWLAYQPQKDADGGDAAAAAADFTGWLPDRDEVAGQLVEPHIALERHQLEVLAQRITFLLDEIKKDAAELAKMDDDTCMDVKGAVVAFTTSLFCPIEADIDVYVSADVQEERDCVLKEHIGRLPFTSATMQAFARDELNDMDVQNQIHVLEELAALLRSMTSGEQGNSNKASGCQWLPSADGNPKLDCFYLPLRYLP